MEGSLELFPPNPIIPLALCLVQLLNLVSDTFQYIFSLELNVNFICPYQY